MAKVEATRNYGATVRFEGAAFEDAVAAAHDHATATGAVFVHAFEDEAVIAGQGTIGLELADQLPGASGSGSTQASAAGSSGHCWWC